jgi:uncharacterized protein (TIGR02391 family)
MRKAWNATDRVGGDKSVTPTFTQPQLEAIAGALGETDTGLTNAEIEFLFRAAKLVGPGAMTKRIRLYNAFAECQNRKKNRTNVLEFIRVAMNPARYSREPHRFEPIRMNLNRALAFAGLVVTDAGKLEKAEAATTLPEADRRARDLRTDLERRNVHADVLVFCRAELLVEDYFHAAQEAVKSVADKIRLQTGLTGDGDQLVSQSLGGTLPVIAINSLATPSLRSEQSGFANLIRGVFGMFRNPTAHEPRIHWAMGKEDAEDLLTILSLIHRRLDAAKKR